MFTVTQLFVPLNDKAWPYFPVVQVVFSVMPLLSPPDLSNTVVPPFSLKPSASTSPFDGMGVDVLVGSAVAALVAVGETVGARVGVDVLVGSTVAALVAVTVGVRVGVGVLVGDTVAARVGVEVLVGSAVAVLVAVCVAVGVRVGVRVGVDVGVGVAVTAAVEVGVGVVEEGGSP